MNAVRVRVGRIRVRGQRPRGGLAVREGGARHRKKSGMRWGKEWKRLVKRGKAEGLYSPAERELLRAMQVKEGAKTGLRRSL